MTGERENRSLLFRLVFLAGGIGEDYREGVGGGDGGAVLDCGLEVWHRRYYAQGFGVEGLNSGREYHLGVANLTVGADSEAHHATLAPVKVHVLGEVDVLHQELHHPHFAAGEAGDAVGHALGFGARLIFRGRDCGDCGILVNFPLKRVW